MIEIALLLLISCGVHAAPRLPSDMDRQYRQLEEPQDEEGDIIDAEDIRLPGAENLDEKSIPISRLYAKESESDENSLPGNQNLEERAQVRVALPGTRNLAEKRIPEYVLRRTPISRRFSDQPDFEMSVQ